MGDCGIPSQPQLDGLEHNQKIAFLEDSFYPFDLDGRNLGKFDLAHCILCGFSILVLEIDGGRIATRPDGTLAFRRVDFMQDSRLFFRKLKDRIRSGDYEAVKQRRAAVRYRRCFTDPPNVGSHGPRESTGIATDEDVETQAQ